MNPFSVTGKRLLLGLTRGDPLEVHHQPGVCDDALPQVAVDDPAQVVAVAAGGHQRLEAAHVAERRADA
jgi:hypothetical protein